ncbi:MAG: MFS transporter [Acutalibacteraceae bacterium]
MKTESSNPAYAGMTSEQIRRFKYWEFRTIAMCIFGYALFYFVRKNLSIAMPYLNEEMGISKSDLGLFLTLHGVIYGLSKFVNGIWGDRSDARRFLVTGLVFCAICNLLFGFSSSVLALGIFWVLNGWFQGMGVPPCTRLMTHWIVPQRLATKMSVWNTSHSIGAGLAIVFCGYAVGLNWDAWFDASSLLSQHWRWCFLLPATVALLGAAIVWALVRDTPSSVGLPELKTGKTTGQQPQTRAEENAEYKAFLRRKVFLNPTIWIIAVGNFFVYVVRFAVLDWGPTMLKEHLHMDISLAGWSVAAFEIAGIAGMLAAGWATGSAVRRAGSPNLCRLHVDGGPLPGRILCPRPGNAARRSSRDPHGGRILHLRSSGARGHRCGQYRDQTGRSHGGRILRAVRLRKHGRFGLGPRAARTADRLECGAFGVDRCCRDRYGDLRLGLEGSSQRLRRLTRLRSVLCSCLRYTQEAV